MINIEDIANVFETLSSKNYGKFNDIENKFSSRPDVHGMIMLEKLFPDETGDMITAAEHDQVWLDVDGEEFAKVATEEIITDLVRCGIWWDDDNRSLSMFV